MIGAGIALLSMAYGRLHIAALVGVVMVFLGLGTLVQFVFDVSFASLNTLFLFDREWGRVGVVDPGRMGPPAATCFMLLGTAFVLRSLPRARSLVPRIAVASLAIAALSIAGYVYGADPLYALPYLTVIALQTASFIAAISIGAMAVIPERAPARWLLDEGATGAVARRAIPLVIVFPLLAGWLRLWGERQGYYESQFGVAMLVMVLIILLLTLLSWTLRTVSHNESALRASERRVTAALESITDGFVTLDANWRYRFVNPQAALMLQRKPEELLGASTWELFPDMVGGNSWNELHRAAAHRTSREFEDHNPHLGRWFQSQAYPTNDGAIAVYFRDVTAQKVAEAERAADQAGMSRLHALSTKLVSTGDTNTLLQEIIGAAAAITGTIKGNIQSYDPESCNLRILVHQGFGAEFMDRFAESGARDGCDRAATNLERVVVEDLEQAKWENAEDRRILLADGIRAFQSTPLVGRDGRLLGVLNTHFPTPYRLSAREERHLDLLARMAADFMDRSLREAALRNADRQKDEFLAMLAHELRNPLAPILNGVRILRLSSDGNQAIGSVSDMLERQVGQLIRLVDDLVDVNRITRGKIELVREHVDVAAVIQQAVEAVRPLVARKGQLLEVDLAREPIHVTGDYTRLTQVVGNVLSNASKFTGANGRIVIEARREAKRVVISISDNGIGLSREQLPHIFDLFMQGDTALERTSSGLGIGLTLVKALVEMHEGTVEARSEGRGMGSEFVIALPVAEVAHVVLASRRTVGELIPPRRVLIVDDNRDGAASLAKVLALSGHATCTAHDGEEAVDVANRFRPDVVLLDLGLPKLNGYEACRRIREQPWGKDVMLVAVTGWGQETYRQRSSEAGFDQHLVKPLDSVTLVSLLQPTIRTGTA